MAVTVQTDFFAVFKTQHGFGQFGDLCHAGEKLCALGLMDEVDLPALRGVYLASREEFLARA